MAKKGSQPTINATKAEVNALLDVNLDEANMEGFVFDIEVARRAFDHFDKNKSNDLSKSEILKLAEKLWNTFYPQGPGLDADGRALLAAEIIKAVDEDGNSSISFEEFVPWFKKMNEKFWASTHPKVLEPTMVQPHAKKAAAHKLGAAAAVPAGAAQAPTTPTTGTTSSGGGSSSAPPAGSPPVPVPASMSSFVGGSDIDAPPAKADMEPIRARLEDLRHSIEQFGSMLDTRLDNWLQTIESYGDQIKGTQGGIV